MKIIETHVTAPEDLSQWERDQVYNGLDVCVTLEILDVLLPQLDNATASTYAFSRSLQGPVLEMCLRGVLVDKARKGKVLEEYFDKLDFVERNLERIVRQGLGFYGFNWRSSDHVKRVLYDIIGVPVIKRQGRATTNREALERIQDYFQARQIVAHLLILRDLGKKIGFLKTDIDPDGRIRTSYNIAGTNTGRFSSSLSEFGTGGNLQNIEDILRSILISDPGKKMAYFDAEQGESRVVGAIEWNLFHDGRYLDMCESGDLHTNVAKLCWPSLRWTGDAKLDKALAEQPFYRHYSRRFMCKKIGHGTNYGGQPNTLSRQAKVEMSVIQDFQPKYFTAFPAHLRWHGWVEREIRESGCLTSLMGRRRSFWGRRDADDTLREAIAYDPQGSLADIVNNGMLNVWRGGDVELLLNVHDAIVVQYPEEMEDDIIPLIRKQLRYPIELASGRQLIIPYGCKTGWNFGEYKGGKNEEGLKDYVPGDKRKRPRPLHMLDRVG